MKRPAAALLMVGVMMATATGQTEMHPAGANQSLLFVQLSGPRGMAAAFFEGDRVTQQLPLPARVGLRPGYIYRLRLDNLPGYRGVALYPSIEVRNALRLPPTMNPAEHAVPVVFSPDDIERAVNGSFVTKVIVLENPAVVGEATPVSSPPGTATELDVLPDQDPETYAKRLGRPMLIVRIGTREPEPMELTRLGPGLILFPGETMVPPASVPPYRFDPPKLIMARGPHGEAVAVPAPPEEECLRDGGDLQVPLHFATDGKLQGINPSDTAATYVDAKGLRRLAITNVVCVCVPRYLAVRHVLPPHGIESLVGPEDVHAGESQARLQARRGHERLKQVESPETMRLRQSLYANVSMTKALRIISLEALGQTRIVAGPVSVTGREALHEARFTCEECCPDGGPLCVHKSASVHHAQIGDVIEFFLRYENCSNQTLRDIAIADSLTGRFEYVAGSARTDREAIFVTQENEAGSQILRWEIRDPLPPGGRGIVSFKAKVR